MKCQIPQISWHCRDPVLSIDFQPGNRNVQRLASGGTDSHVLIWYITYDEYKSVKVECASDLYRHNKSVNVVRFSPNGELLSSGDDEGAIFIWQLKEKDEELPKDDEDINQEYWYPLKLLRGHLEDVYDISWSSDGNFLASASMDNTAIVWDMQKFQKLHICSESKGFVQGIAWDPLNTYIASIGSDRVLRIWNINTKKSVHRIQRAPWCIKTEKGTIRPRLFYDDTLQSYFRRLCFTPDGEFLIVPSGISEKDNEKSKNTTYIFSRHCLSKPVLQLPTGDKYTVAVRCSPFLYKLLVNSSQNLDLDKENQNPKPKAMIDLPYRMIFAVAACDSILLYDTEQLLPFAYVSNIHYTHLTDLSWSADGKTLVASSTDGYCSFINFSDGQLGEIYVPPPVEKEVIENVVPSVVEKSIKKKSNVKDTIVSDKDQSPIIDKHLNSPETVKTLTSESSKSNKKPKLCTIKNFFSSPKTSMGESFKSKPVNESTDKKILKNLNSCSTPISVSPTKSKKESISRERDPMDVDANSIEVVFVSKSVK